MYEVVLELSDMTFTYGPYPFKWMAEMRCRSVNKYRYRSLYVVRKVKR